MNTMSCSACINTDHFCPGFKCSYFHVFRAAVVTWRPKFDLHPLLVLLLTLQAVGHRLDRLHPFLPEPQ